MEKRKRLLNKGRTQTPALQPDNGARHWWQKEVMKTDFIAEIIKALEDHQSSLFEQGHTFWHCDMADTNTRTNETLPFRYYQTNRSVHMSTCSTCSKLMELRKEIRKWQKLANIYLTPLHTRFTTPDHVKRMSVKDSREYNINYSYL